VDIIATAPVDITDPTAANGLSDGVIYGFHLASASELTRTLSLDNNLIPHTTHTSIEFADMMYRDVLSDGVLNGVGFRASTTADPTDQVIPFFIGTTAVNTDMYRRLLALSMLRVAESDYNVTGVTLVDIFSNAERYSMSTSGLFSNEVPSPIDITPPVITSSAVGSATYSGVLNYPVIVNDLLDIKRIDYS